MIKKLHKQLEHPNLQGYYVVGAGSSSIAAAQQQTRALNLIVSLIEDNIITRKSKQSIAVIGAGFTGVTATTALLSKGFKVSLFEQDSNSFSRQFGSDTRELHPNAHLWPQQESSKSETDFPFLNWRANSASSVTKYLRSQWNLISDFFVQNKLLSREYNRKASVDMKSSKGYQIDLLIQNTEEEKITNLPPQVFDIVIYAGGFGCEKGEQRGSVSYWHGDNLSSIKGDIFITGTSDGGLADVLRASLRDYNLIDTIRHFSSNRWDEIKEKLLNAEMEARKNPSEEGRMILTCYHSIFQELPKDLLNNFLTLSRGNQVIMHGKTKYPYSLKATIYNRFWTYLLWQSGKGVSYEHSEMSLDKINISNNAEKSTIIIEDTVRSFDYISIRRGVIPTEGNEEITPFQVDFTDEKSWNDDFFPTPWVPSQCFKTRTADPANLIQEANIVYKCSLYRIAHSTEYEGLYKKYAQQLRGYEKIILELGRSAHSITEEAKTKTSYPPAESLKDSIGVSYSTLMSLSNEAFDKKSYDKYLSQNSIEAYCNNTSWQCDINNPVKLFEVGLLCLLRSDYHSWDQCWTKAIEIFNNLGSNAILKVEGYRLRLRHFGISYLTGYDDNFALSQKDIKHYIHLKGDILFLLKVITIFIDIDGHVKLSEAITLVSQKFKSISPLSIEEAKSKITQIQKHLKAQVV